MAGAPEAGIYFPKLIVNAYKLCNNCTGDCDGLITQLKVHAPKEEIIKLFPNPVKDKLTITGLSNDEISHLQLADATGRVIQNTTTQNSIFQWNMQALPNGVYYLNVIKEKGLPVSFKGIKE